MYRATTPLQLFNLKTDAASLKKLLITYKQGDNIILRKTKADVTADGNTVSFYLTQEETKLFTSDKAVYIQIRFKDANDRVVASEEITAQVYDVHNDEVL